MGIIVGGFFLRRWLFLAGFVVVVLGGAIPWTNPVVRDWIVAVGAAVLLAQIPVAIHQARRIAQPDRGPPDPPPARPAP